MLLATNKGYVSKRSQEGFQFAIFKQTKTGWKVRIGKKKG